MNGTCNCYAGYNGTNCNNLYNCVLTIYTKYLQTGQTTGLDPCVNGACPKDGVHTLCVCNTGYTGSTCNQIADNCASNPCQNGASCRNSIGSYQCVCATGYTGAQCQTLINNCASNPCQNGGSCVNAVGSYSCQCPLGYTGPNCQTVINYCDSNQCQSGSCVNGLGFYTCQCNQGYTGTYCDIGLNSTQCICDCF